MVECVNCLIHKASTTGTQQRTDMDYQVRMVYELMLVLGIRLYPNHCYSFDEWDPVSFDPFTDNQLLYHYSMMG